MDLLEEVVNTAEEFHKLYYETLDRRRHLIARLYLDSAVLIWDGNPLRTVQEIQKFFEALPTTKHQIIGMDAQPVSLVAVPLQKTIMIQVEGNVQFLRSGERAPKQFYQSFTITAHEDKWKIVSDCFRLIPDSR